MDYSKTTLSKYYSEEEILALKESTVSKREIIEEPSKKFTKEKVAKAMEYIPYIGVSVFPNDKAYISDMSLQDIADECDLNESQLEQLCKDYQSVSKPQEDENEIE